jgi:uncharacterized protein (DUF2267 family)
MEHTYTVSGGRGGPCPGAIGPDELEGDLEWRPVPRDPGLVGRVAARLGSEVDARRVILAVLGPLRAALNGRPLDAVLAGLPRRLAQELAEVEWNLNAPVPPANDAVDYLLTVARLARFPPRTAASYVVAVFAALRATLGPGEADVVAERLPADIAELWRVAR